MATVTVLAEEGPITLGFEDLVRYHGHGALAMLAVAFRAQCAALARLCPGAPPRRDEIQVVSGHPGPGVRDAFEMVARCVTRGAYRIDPALPGPRLNPRGDAVYAFEIMVAGRGSQHVALNPGVLPPEFFALLGAASEAERNAGFALRRRLAGEIVECAEEQLFTLG